MRLKYAYLYCFLLAAMLVAIFSGCMFSATETETKPEIAAHTDCARSFADPESLYMAAADKVNQAQMLTLSVEYTTNISVGEVTFSEDCLQTITYQGYGTEKMRARVREQRNIGTYNILSTLAFEDDIGYLAIENGYFQSNMSAEAFSARYVPAVILTPSLYKQIQAVEDSNKVTVTFTEPVAPEAWLNLANETASDMKGIAVLDLNGNLLESRYRFTLQRGQTQIQYSVQVAVDMTAGVVEMPDHADYVRLDVLDAPLMLERACGYLLQATTVTAESKESATCDAYGDERVQKIALKMAGEDTVFTANLSAFVGVVNHSRAGEVTENTYEMHYANGSYRTWENGEMEKEQVVAPPETMRTYCRDIMLGTVILPEYISSAEIFDEGDTYLISVTANEIFAKLTRQNACHVLYQDPNLPDALENQKITDSASAYLAVNKATGLPVASGVEYLGTFSIAEQPYSLTYQSEQNYLLTDIS